MLRSKSIVFPCDLKNLQSVRNFVRRELNSHLLTDLVKNQIVLAVDEVCANLIIHSNNQDNNQIIELNLEINQTPKGITIELTETGKPFDYLKYSEPTISSLIENSTNGKMGLMLVRRIMDNIEYIHRDNKNICRLYKSLA
jgi:serine/threonine-protein kinase RsbW